MSIDNAIEKLLGEAEDYQEPTQERLDALVMEMERALYRFSVDLRIQVEQLPVHDYEYLFNAWAEPVHYAMAETAAAAWEFNRWKAIPERISGLAFWKHLNAARVQIQRIEKGDVRFGSIHRH